MAHPFFLKNIHACSIIVKVIIICIVILYISISLRQCERVEIIYGHDKKMEHNRWYMFNILPVSM